MSVTHTASNPSSPKTGSNLNEITSDTASPSIIERDSPVMLCHPPNSPVGTSLILAMLSSIPTSPGDCQVISIYPLIFLTLLHVAKLHKMVMPNWILNEPLSFAVQYSGVRVGN